MHDPALTLEARLLLAWFAADGRFAALFTARGARSAGKRWRAAFGELVQTRAGGALVAKNAAGVNVITAAGRARLRNEVSR